METTIAFRLPRMNWCAAFMVAALFTVQDVSAQCEQFDIYGYNTISGTTRQLTFIENGSEFNPSWSPNRQKVVHDVLHLDASCASTGIQDLYVTDVRTGVSTPLAGGEGGDDAAWSPDGRQIAFDKGPSEANIYVVPYTGGTPTLVVNDADHVDWSPSGTHIVFERPSNGSIWIRELASGTETMVAMGNNPAWSPNGRAIAFSAGDASFSIVYRVRVNASGTPIESPVALTTPVTGVYDGSVDWQGNAYIIFHSNRGSSFDVWSVPSVGGSIAGVTGDASLNEFDPGVSRNNRLIAFSRITVAPVSASELAAMDESFFVDQAEIPTSTALLNNYPNPFNPTTMIAFTLSEQASVKLAVYDLLGRQVAQLVDGVRDAGYYEVNFEAGELPGGTYLYRLETPEGSFTRKLVLLK